MNSPRRPRSGGGFAPAYMLDQSHNVTDPIESLMQSAIEIARAYAQALIVDARRWPRRRSRTTRCGAHLLKCAFTTDVSPLIAEARHRAGGAIEPIAAYRASGYRAAVARERPTVAAGSAEIV